MHLAAATLIALACIAVAEPRLLGRAWPQAVLSAGAGVGIAYVVVHLLPELAEGAELVQRSTDGKLPYAEAHVYLLVLVGIIGTLALHAVVHGRHGLRPHPRLQILQPALSALLVGYLLAVRDDPAVGVLMVFAVAIGLHVAINAHTLTTRLQAPLSGLVLAGAIVAGFSIGTAWEAPPVAVAGIVALLAGGVMTRTIHEVLEEEQHLTALVLGATLETAFLLVLY